ncbi:unnamed protein product, partial [Rotaria sordida]
MDDIDREIVPLNKFEENLYTSTPISDLSSN